MCRGCLCEVSVPQFGFAVVGWLSIPVLWLVLKSTFFDLVWHVVGLLSVPELWLVVVRQVGWPVLGWLLSVLWLVVGCSVPCRDWSLVVGPWLVG